MFKIIDMSRLLYTFDQIYYLLRSAVSKLTRRFVYLNYILCIVVEHVTFQTLKHLDWWIAFIQKL